MIALSTVAYLLTALYIALMAVYRYGWLQHRPFVPPAGFSPVTPVAVVVPARNEARNIGSCLAALLAQDYPRELLQIFVVDDHSEDGTAAVVQQLTDERLHCIRLADYPVPPGTVAFKKRALALGFKHASDAVLVVTTDADCIAPRRWLKTLVARFETDHPAAIAGPVSFSSDGTAVQDFQAIDFLSMQGITVAAGQLGLGTMGNGANLAIRRDAFEAVGGYDGVDQLASGDDFLLLHKLKKAFPGGIAYLQSESAIVSTKPQPDWRSFLAQRIRWASKSGKYPDYRLTAILLLVYLLNVSLAACVAGAIFRPVLLIIAAALLLLKGAAEYWFLVPVLTWYGRRELLRKFFLLQPIHVLYVVLAGFFGLAGSYRWKGRRVR